MKKKNILLIGSFALLGFLVIGGTCYIFSGTKPNLDNTTGSTMQIPKKVTGFYEANHSISSRLELNEGDMLISLNKDKVNSIYNPYNSLSSIFNEYILDSYKALYLNSEDSLFNINDLLDESSNDNILNQIKNDSSLYKLELPIEIYFKVESESGKYFEVGCEAYFDNNIQANRYNVFFYSLNSESKIVENQIFNSEKDDYINYGDNLLFKTNAKELKISDVSIYSSNKKEIEDSGEKIVNKFNLKKFVDNYIDEKLKLEGLNDDLKSKLKSIKALPSKIATEIWDLFDVELSKESPTEESTLSFDKDRIKGIINGSYTDEFKTNEFDSIIENYCSQTGCDDYGDHLRIYKNFKNPKTLETVQLFVEISLSNEQDNELRLSNGWSTNSEVYRIEVYFIDQIGKNLIFTGSIANKYSECTFTDLTFDLTGFIEDGASKLYVEDNTLLESDKYGLSTDTDMADFITNQVIKIKKTNGGEGNE